MSGRSAGRRDLVLIAAVDQDMGIGKDGDLPWSVPADMRHFQRMTRNTRGTGARNAVIMGRKTWDSLAPAFQPLKGRVNVVLSRRQQLSLPEGVIHARDLDDALALLDDREAAAADGDRARDARTIERIFVVGGAEIYALALAHPRCGDVYLTRIEGRFGCDTRFPELPARYRLVDVMEQGTSGGLAYRVEHWRLPNEANADEANANEANTDDDTANDATADDATADDAAGSAAGRG